MHIVYKPGKTRVCLDPKDLNQYIMREHYPMSTVEEVAARMQGATIFSWIDASSGYWQIPLDEESSYLTTYNTPSEGIGTCACLSGYPQQVKFGSAACKKSLETLKVLK